MFKMMKKIMTYPRLTQDYPKKPLDSHLFVGSPVIDEARCIFCGECVTRCPSTAMVIDKEKHQIGINYDTCIFCGLCAEICPEGAVTMSTAFELAQKDRRLLRKETIVIEGRDPSDESYIVLCNKLQQKIQKKFKRSLQIREIDAGSCNGCDLEINALNNPFNDIERLGIHFVPSPRHADMLLVTGPVTRNMEQALIKTYQAAPDPKLVVAVGACACSGGIFRDCYATHQGVDSILPVDVYIPGCPPRPQAIINGLLMAIK
ncbi:MAG: NADH-quinone oxidoreductase subunit NuoB [Bacillota bacterium]|nr:NADH-quinone oxidoreductase subunit NuoB [Bacillota bacterium]